MKSNQKNRQFPVIIKVMLSTLLCLCICGIVLLNNCITYHEHLPIMLFESICCLYVMRNRQLGRVCECVGGNRDGRAVAEMVLNRALITSFLPQWAAAMQRSAAPIKFLCLTFCLFISFSLFTCSTKWQKTHFFHLPPAETCVVWSIWVC